jgi:O-antigen/teichoic acid export membrane protein
MSREKAHAVREVVKGGGIIFVSLFLSYLFAFIYQILAARYLSVEDFGLFSMGIAVLSLGMALGQFGMANAAKRFVSYHLSRNEHAAVRGTIIAACSISLICTIIIAATVFLLADFISISIFSLPKFAPVLKVFAVAMPFSNLLLLFEELFLAFRRPVYKAVVETGMDKVVKVLLLLAIMFAAGTVLHVSLAYLAGTMIATAVSFFLMYALTFRPPQGRESSASRASSSPAAKAGKISYDYRELLVFAFPLFLACIVAELTKRLDKLIVGYFLSASDAGIYSIAFTFAEFMTIGLTALGALYYPVITGFLGRKKLNRISGMYMSVTRLSFVIMLPLMIAYIVFSREIIGNLYGPGYVAGGLPLIILSAGFLASLVFGPASVTLEVFKKTKLVFYVYAFTAALNLMLDIIFIKLWGLVGIAVATAFSLALTSFLFVMLVRKEIRIRSIHPNYIRYLGAGIASGILVFLLKQILPAGNIYMLVLECVIICAAYFASLLALKSFTEEDKMLLLAIEAKVGIKRSIISRFLR